MTNLTGGRFPVKGLVLALSALSATAMAQSEEPLVLEEVLVTAQKRVQSLQDVPVSVTAFTADVIDRARIEDFSDYAVKTPNVGFQQRGNNAETKFGIRGVTNIGGQASSVGMYVDEVSVVPNVITTGASRTADTSLLESSLMFGGTVLYAFGFAAFVFTALPAETAGGLIRRAFPHFYLFVLVTSALAAAVSVTGDQLSAAILATIAVTTLFARQVLMPAINAATDAGNKARFKTLHTLSVLITLAHIAAAAYTILRLAQGV